MRDLYFVPVHPLQQDTQQIKQLDDEITQVLHRTYGKHFEFKRKPVVKNYCFELDLPPS